MREVRDKIVGAWLRVRLRLGEDGRSEGHEEIGRPHGVDCYVRGTVRISRGLALAGRGPWRRGSCETSNAKEDCRGDLANCELARQPVE